ncbi:tripartite tricarboxylate transporter TctB family protein [Chloroflexota bacterium]
MKPRLRQSSYVLIAIIIVALFFGYFSLTFHSMKGALFPGVISILVFILAAIELVRDLTVKGKDEANQEVEGEVGVLPGDRGNVPLRRYFITFGWMAGLLLGIYLVGFLISIPLFIFPYLKLHGRGWLLSLALAAIATAVIFLVFVAALQVDLFPGKFFGGIR